MTFASKDNNEIILQNLPLKTFEYELRHLLEGLGESYESVSMISGRGFGFVRFSTSARANAFVCKYHNGIYLGAALAKVRHTRDDDSWEGWLCDVIRLSDPNLLKVRREELHEKRQVFQMRSRKRRPLRR